MKKIYRQLFPQLRLFETCIISLVKQYAGADLKGRSTFYSCIWAGIHGNINEVWYWILRETNGTWLVNVSTRCQFTDTSHNEWRSDTRHNGPASQGCHAGWRGNGGGEAREHGISQPYCHMYAVISCLRKANHYFGSHRGHWDLSLRTRDPMSYGSQTGYYKL